MKRYFKFVAMMAVSSALSLVSCGGEKQTNSEMTETSVQTPIENIMSRASVRRFTNKAISKDTLETIVKAGMAAPTAVNKQPWEFIVVTDRVVLDSLMAHHPHANLETATAAIVVCGNMENALEGDGQAYWIQDCSAATENILLAAHSLGVGAVWCGVYPMQDRVAPVRETLKLPSYVTPLNIITMGYPAAPSQPKDKWNPDKLHFQQW